MTNKCNKSYLMIRKEEGKPDAYIYWPGDALISAEIAAIRMVQSCEDEGYKVLNHEIKPAVDDKCLGVVVLTVSSSARK